MEFNSYLTLFSVALLGGFIWGLADTLADIQAHIESNQLTVVRLIGFERPKGYNIWVCKEGISPPECVYNPPLLKEETHHD